MTYLAQIEKLTGLTGVKIEPAMTTQYTESGKPIKRTTCCFLVRAANPNPGLSPIEIARFCLCQLPGCCGVCLSFHTRVSSIYCGKGVGKVLMKLKEQMAHQNGYTMMVATDVTRNEAQQKIFKWAKWVKADSFTNRRTRHEVGVYTRALSDTGVMIGCDLPSILTSP